MEKLQTELFTMAAAKRSIKNACANLTKDLEPNDVFIFDLDDKAQKYLNLRYGAVKRIDTMLQSGKIVKTEAAQRKRKIFVSMLLNYMVRNCVVDMNILQKEGITLGQLMERYYYHYATTEWIAIMLTQNPEMKTEIKRLARLGEPYSSKHGKEKAMLKKEQEELSKKKNTGNLFRQYVTSGTLGHMEAELEILEEDDEIGGEFFPIENLCCKIIYREHPELRVEKDNPFSMKNLWYMTPTSLDKLLGWMVVFYKEKYADAIKAHRQNESRKRKNEKRQKKAQTAQEKREQVQQLKAQGKSFSEALKEVSFSDSTFKRLWREGPKLDKK